jgi:anti-anti-sigma regulatory factor
MEPICAAGSGTSSPWTFARPTVPGDGRPGVVRVVGFADRATVVEVSGRIRGLRAVGVRHLVVDLSAAVTCDRSLLTVLARQGARLADENGSLTVVGVRLPSVLAAMRAATVDEVFVIYDAVRGENVSG